MWYGATPDEDVFGPVIAVDLAKSRLRIDVDDADELLGDLINEAAAYIEGYCNVSLRQRVFVCQCDSFADLARLPVGPVTEDGVLSISYFDRSGVAQILDPSVYRVRVNGLDAAILPQPGHVWPGARHGELITVTLTAGYKAVPLEIRDAILLRVATRYHKPENEASGGWTEVDFLLVNHRRGGG